MAEYPFSWTQQKEGCVFTRLVWKPVECRRDKCQLWSGSDCVLNEIARRLNSLKEVLQNREGSK